MNSTRGFRKAGFARRWFSAGGGLLLVCGAVFAQSAIVRISAPAPNVIAGASMQLQGNITDLAGTPVDSSGLVWSSSDPNSATVSADGTVEGLLPADVAVTAADTISGASASMLLHIIPLSISLQPGSLELAAGSTATLSAQALDAGKHPITGVTFQYRSGQPAVADVAADGTVTAIAEGFVTIEARIRGGGEQCRVARNRSRARPAPPGVSNSQGAIHGIGDPLRRDGVHTDQRRCERGDRDDCEPGKWIAGCCAD